MNAGRKKLIEVALPLKAINAASAREKSIRHGHPSTLHLWWARRPLAAARAVLFAQMVDDPSARPEQFPTDEAQSHERQRLFRIIEELVKWENTTNETVLGSGAGGDSQELAADLRGQQGPSQGGGAVRPGQAPRLPRPLCRGRLNTSGGPAPGSGSPRQRPHPVAVLINKAMIEIPPKFAGKPPVNLEARKGKGSTDAIWKGAAGLAEDVRYYGKWVREEAEKRIGHLYPKIEVTAEMAQERPDLESYVGRKLTVIAWIWARTVKSPNPAYSDVEVPLVATFHLTKQGGQPYVKPVIENGHYRFTVRAGKPPEADRQGTKLSGSNFQCLMSGTVITADYVRQEAQAGRMGSRLMAVVAEGNKRQLYLPPSDEHEAIAKGAEPAWKPDLRVPTPCHDVDRLPMYGMPTWGDAFADRQLVALTTFSDLVVKARGHIENESKDAGLANDGIPLSRGGKGAKAYAEAVGVYLALAVGRSANYWSSMTPWGGSFLVQTFGLRGIPMVWDHAEGNPLSHSTGNWVGGIKVD